MCGNGQARNPSRWISGILNPSPIHLTAIYGLPKRILLNRVREERRTGKGVVETADLEGAPGNNESGHSSGSVGISIDRLPPYRYSLNALGHLLSTRQEFNKVIQNDIYKQFVQVIWTNS